MFSGAMIGALTLFMVEHGNDSLAGWFLQTAWSSSRDLVPCNRHDRATQMTALEMSTNDNLYGQAGE